MAAPSALFLIPGRHLPSSRVRVLQYLPLLERDGWRATVRSCLDGAAPDARDSRPWYDGALVLAQLHQRFYAALTAGRYDVVYIERELVPRITPVPEQMVRMLNRTVIFDFDDAIFLPYENEPVNPVGTVVGLSRTVITGNEYLGEWALRHNDNVWVLPSAIDCDRFTPRTGIGDGRLLVWSGLSRHLDELRPIVPSLQQTAAKYPGLRLRVVSDRPPRFDLGIPVEFVPWTPETEITALQTADIGIMPLKDDDWTKGKAGYKVLQYMACGLATISAPYGVIPDVTDAGTCGLPAQDVEEWNDSLDRLVGDAELRRLMGEEARRRVEDIYSVKAIYPRWRDVLESTREGVK